ncbi:MAG TPA: DUF4835 family protein [Chitinophagaceae bacterium]|nr:DUF4835 family protein [Chitinophagaceae bacterium]
MNKNLFLSIVAFSFVWVLQGQEIQARITVNVNKDKISTQIDRKIFQTLQTALTNFVNNRKWTNDVFQTNEKIQCNFLLNINDVVGQNLFKATLMVQAARPAYNSGYLCPLINYIDENLYFRYQEFQPVEFNENRIQGTDPLASNLTAVIAYWVNMILGFDYDSFSLRGGDIYFQKAQNIVNNAPESRDITGWKNFESLRNRYWLAENINNNRFALLHDAIYSYYRSGMDIFYENEEEGRNGILNCLNFLGTLNTENPNSMIIQFFFQGKSSEIVKVFSKANKEMKERALNLLLKLDITNARVYNELK